MEALIRTGSVFGVHVKGIEHMIGVEQIKGDGDAGGGGEARRTIRAGRSVGVKIVRGGSQALAEFECPKQ